MIDLYVNNTRIPLAGSERIQLKKAAAKIGSLQSRTGHFTNDFRVSASAEIRDIFGYSNRLETQSTFPQVKQEAKLLLNGQNEIARGFVQLVGYDFRLQEFQLTFFSGIAPWVSLIGDAQLSDIYLSDYDHVWDTAAITGSFDNTEGYIYPWIDYGRLGGIDGTPTYPMKITDWYPAMFQHTLIYRMFEAIEYKVGGSFTESWEWKQTLIPFSNNTLVNTDGTQYVPGNTITIAPNLPELSQVDFLRDMVIRHALLVTVNEATRTVNFDTLDSVIDKISEAVDWSDRVDLSRVRSLDFRELVQQYGQATWFRYQEPGEEEFELRLYERLAHEKHADGKLTINNAFLSNDVTLYTSPFYPSIIGKSFVVGGTTPYANLPAIKLKDEDSEENVYDPGPRILYLVGNITISEFAYKGASQYNLEDSTGSIASIGLTAPWAYFTKPVITGQNPPSAETASTLINSIDRQLSYNEPFFTAPFNLGFEYESQGNGLLAQFYSKLLRILNTPRYIEVSVKLWSYDFFNFDFTTPVFIHAGNLHGYFYVEEIEYNGEEPATAKLIQII